MENKAIIDAHNARSDTTFKMGQTPYSDFSSEEFRGKVLKYAPKKSLSEKRAEKKARAEARARAEGAGQHIPGVTPASGLGLRRNRAVSSYPKNFNWADVPEVMGKIHTQETSCASCWAYTSTDTIEAQLIISGRRKKHVELSAEQLINCDRYDSGCNTGNMFTAYEWIHENGGLATARAFHGAAAAAAASARSYMGAEASASAAAAAGLGEGHHAGAAMVGEASMGASNSGELGIYFEELGAEDERRVLDSIESSLGSSNGNCPADLQLQDRVFGYCELDFEAGEEALMEAVSKQPVAIGINANKVFQLYASGIITAKDCGPAPHTPDSEIMAINHAVVVTGWGEEWIKGRLIKYWILKNSFGEGWGEKGYFKLERGPHTLDAEGFGTCGMYFESVYPVIDEKARSKACVPGSTYRTKYYSAAGAATLGNVAPKKEAPVVGRVGHPKMATLLVGVGFIAGLLVSSIFVAMGRFTSWTRRASEESISLLPN